MELSIKSVSQSKDLESCSFSDKLYSSDGERQPNCQSFENNDVSNNPQPDSKHLCSLSSTKSMNGKGIEKNMPENKKLVVKLCDFMICSKENCDLREYKKYRKKQKIKQKEVDQHHFSREKYIRNKSISLSESQSNLSNGKCENDIGVDGLIPKDKKLVVELCDFLVHSREDFDVMEDDENRNEEEMQEIEQMETDKHDLNPKKEVKSCIEEQDENDISDVDQDFGDKKVNNIRRISSDHEIKDTEEDLNDKKDSNDSDGREKNTVSMDSDSEERKDSNDSAEEKYSKKRKQSYRQCKEEVRKRSRRPLNKEKRVPRKKKTGSDEDDSSYCDLVSGEEEESNNESGADFEEVSNESESESSMSNNSDDSDWEMPNKKKRQPKAQKKKLKERKKQKSQKKEEKKTEPLSGFELMRQKNVDDKMAFLKSLRMNELVEDLEETVKAVQKKKIKVKKEKVVNEVSRKSKRMENVNINFSEEALEAKVYKDADDEVNSNAKPKIPRIYTFEDAFCGDENISSPKYEMYFGSLKMKETSKKKNTNNSPYDLNRFDPMLSTTCEYPFSLSYITFHPAVNKSIILAGSTSGHISLWNTDTYQYSFAPHSACVSRLEAHPDYPHWLISSSHDGTLRITDLNRECFVEILKDDSPLKSFDFLSPDGYLVSQANGLISVIDSRLKRNNSGQDLSIVKQWEGSKKSVNHITIHPTKQICLSSDADGFLKIWDLRKIRNPIWKNKCPIGSAFFSPVTGNSILFSNKEAVSIYDSSNEAKCNKKIKFGVGHFSEQLVIHKPLPNIYRKDSQLGFRSRTNHYSTAKWIPSSDNTFIVCNNFENSVFVLNINGEKMSSLKTSNIIMHQAVHPSQNKLAISNNRSSGNKRASLIKLYMEKNET